MSSGRNRRDWSRGGDHSSNTAEKSVYHNSRKFESRRRSRSPDGYRRHSVRRSRSRSPDRRSGRDRDRDWNRERERDRDRDRYMERGRRDDVSRRDRSPGRVDSRGDKERRNNTASTLTDPAVEENIPQKEDQVVYGEDDLEAINSFMEHEGADSDVEDDPMVSAKAAEEREMELRRQRREEIKRKYEAVSSASGGSSADVSMAAGGPVSRVVAVAELVPPPAMTVVSGQSGITVARGISDGDRYAGEGDRLEQEKEATAEFESSRAESSALDMFSLSPTVLPPAPAGKGLGAKTASRLALETDYSEADNPHLHMEWDDGDGYYRARVGEVVAGRYRTLGVLGKGVFSSVLKCLDLTPPVAGLATNAVSVVAVKMIRSNDVMKKAAEKELSILTQISRSDPERRKHCVILLDRLEYRNHIALVFEHQAMNLRETIKKFGKGVGISITAVRLYARQLFVALRYLAELQVVHADIKPDNILISDDLKQVKLCDFGSAFYTHDADSNTPTPYLVSRFYRAPEIILGLSYDHAIDVWGIGSVLFELFTGHVQFPGRSNNDMLRLMMMAKGRLPNKLIKQHVKSYEGLQMEPHFATDGNSVDLKFKQYEKDPVSDKLQMKLVDVSPHPVVQLSSTLLGAKAGSDDRKTVGHLIDLLEKASVLDQARRLTVSDALKHSIFGAPASVSIASGQRPSSGPNTAVSGNV